MPPNLNLIAALDRAGAIGRNGCLPWHLPEDLKRFKSLTLGQPVIMGRKTWQSLPRALPGRSNIVLSRDAHFRPDGALLANTLEQAIALADSAAPWIIGGAEIYALALPHASQLFLTEVDCEISGADTWFPGYDQAAWQLLNRMEHPADARHACAFSFCDYRRSARTF